MKIFIRYLHYSTKNGLIIVHRIGGSWEVLVRGTPQTSRRYPAMWSDAAQHSNRLRPDLLVKNVLLLGLGGGGALKPLYESFPDCTITAVEYDSEMIAIAAEIELYKPYPAPTIIEADAGKALTKLEVSFDLIAVDLFYGLRPSPIVSDPAFWKNLHGRLTPGGAVLINTCINPEVLSVARDLFPHESQWTYNANVFALLWS